MRTIRNVKKGRWCWKRSLDMGSVVHNQDYDGHALPPFIHHSFARQGNDELGEVTDLAMHGDAAAVLLRDNVVADRQAKARAFAGRLGGEEGGRAFQKRSPINLVLPFC
jgi:hypothetical protein